MPPPGLYFIRYVKLAVVSEELPLLLPALRWVRGVEATGGVRDQPKETSAEEVGETPGTRASARKRKNKKKA